MGAAVASIPTIPERRAALAAATSVWTERTLDAFLADRAQRSGDRPLVLADDGPITYAQVDAHAGRLAAGLIALGVRPGGHVGLLMANHPEFVALKFAIARAGAVAIPFNFLYREDELAYVLAQSRCDVLITMTAYGDLEYLPMLDRIADRIPELHHIITLEPARDGILDVAGLAELGDAPPPSGSLRRPGELGDILYTSGTTGSPKGVMVTHDAVIRTGYASALTRAFEDGRRVLFSLPCYHMFGYVEGILAAMWAGGAIIPRLRFTPADYFASIERFAATEILAVPTMTVALLESPARHEHDTSTLFALLSGAAPAPVWLWEKVRAELGVTDLTTGYGMTECGGAMTLTLPEDPIERHAGTVGRPKLAGVAGLGGDGPICEYATTEIGELISRGPTHMLGYWEKPAETAEALADGWLHSGDLGVVDADGYLRVTGRSKELYKSGGELVMPKEIEDLITQRPGISQAYAVGVVDDRWGEIGCLWVVPEPGTDVDTDALMAHCRANLARFKVPKLIFTIDAESLPRTPTGKVQKFRLVEMAGQRPRG